MTFFVPRFFLTIINRNENRIARTVVERKRVLHTIAYLFESILWSPCGWEIEENEREQQALGSVKLLWKTAPPTVWQSFTLGTCICAGVLHTFNDRPFKQNKFKEGRTSQIEAWWKCLWCAKYCLSGREEFSYSQVKWRMENHKDCRIAATYSNELNQWITDARKKNKKKSWTRNYFLE